jgi:hypothetical protein
LNLKPGAVDHLLTSGFVFLLCGFPQLADRDLKTRPVQRPRPSVPDFFRRAADRPTTPGAAALELILSLASAAWRSVIPPGNAGPVYLKYMYVVAGAKTKNRVTTAVCRFILRIRYDALLDALRGCSPGETAGETGDLYAACDALRATLIMEEDVGPECGSDFLMFLKSESEDGCVPWTWMLRDGMYRRLDALILKHRGFVGPLPPGLPSKPVGLDAQQLCARVSEALQGPTCQRGVAGAQLGTMRDLMDIVARYLLVRWKTQCPPTFFDGLDRYLLALRDPELRTFLTPRAWGFFEQCPECLPALAHHFLSDACTLGRGSTRWFVPSQLLETACNWAKPPLPSPLPASLPSCSSPRVRVPRQMFVAGSGGAAKRQRAPLD